MNNGSGERRSNSGSRIRTIEIVNRSLPGRYRAERRFRLYGLLAVIASLTFLSLLLVSIFVKGYTAFWQTAVRLDVTFDPEVFTPKTVPTADYHGLVARSLGGLFPEVEGRSAKRELNALVSTGAVYQLRRLAMDNPEVIGRTVSVWVPADDDVDMWFKGHFDQEGAAGRGRLSERQVAWLERLAAEHRIQKRFNHSFFTSGDSREPELAGIWGAVMGSFYTLIVTAVLSFPIGVAAAIYLEEFAPTNRWTDLIEVNINNLAAVPSIVFGLLGLAVFLNLFGLPRSAPLVGGLVLSLMTLPVIIIASRASLRSVPPSVREAALSVGASKVQMVMHHVLPLALPGMLTGAIIGMAQALGETAPLLMIGMVAFIVDIPRGFYDPATVLPVQIFLWADSPERAFVELTSAAIVVLLAFLLLMNAAAVILRRRFERRW
jgi:phosphate transport system permease protein